MLALVAVLFTWWGWKQGAYFGSVFYPGALATFLLLALLLAMAPFAVRFTGPARVALLALLGLAVLGLASALWSPLPAAAVEDAWHGFLFLALFVVGVWTTHLLRARMAMALVPVAVAGAAIAVATVAVLANGSDVAWYLHSDATLRFPIGYRNADAAFFLICLWPLLALVSGGWDWRLRSLLVGLGTVLVELTFLSQSRGSVPAALLAGVLFVWLSRDRLRAAAAIALVAVPVLPALPSLLDVYRHGEADAVALSLLGEAAQAIWLTALLSLALAALAFGFLGPRLRLEAGAREALSRGLALLALLAALGGGAIFVARHGGPLDFVDQRVDEFGRIGYPDLHGQGIRYGANVGSNRHDFWRVAIDEGREKPLLGGGGGSFKVTYLQDRRSDETPEDPHSVEALMLAELGLPGLALLVAFVVAAAMAALRSRRLGPAAAALVAGALAAAAQWLTQASYDWLWNYPGVTAPVMFMLGAAAAPALLDPAARYRGGLRMGVAVGILIVALISAPLYLSARYVRRGYGEAKADPRLAIADFQSAARLNPLDAEPLLAKGTVEAHLGERQAALASLRDAVQREPDGYLPRYLIAAYLAASDPAAARVELARARALNPSDRAIAALERRLEADPR